MKPKLVVYLCVGMIFVGLAVITDIRWLGGALGLAFWAGTWLGPTIEAKYAKYK